MARQINPRTGVGPPTAQPFYINVESRADDPSNTAEEPAQGGTAVPLRRHVAVELAAATHLLHDTEHIPVARVVPEAVHVRAAVAFRGTPTVTSDPPVLGHLEAHPDPPNDFLAWAWVSFILCPPLGALSVIQARKVQDLWYVGDYEGARKDSRKALVMIQITFLFSIVAWLSIILYFVIYH